MLVRSRESGNEAQAPASGGMSPSATAVDSAPIPHLVSSGGFRKRREQRSTARVTFMLCSIASEASSHILTVLFAGTVPARVVLRS
jgi:hypothetical protein